MMGNPDAYYQRPEVSNSDLTELKNILHPRMQSGDKEAAFRFGTLVDAIITEPSRVDYYRLTVDGEQYGEEEFRHALEIAVIARAPLDVDHVYHPRAVIRLRPLGMPLHAPLLGSHQVAALDTPKSTGETVGKVVAVSSGCSTVDIATKAEIANGDGLVYLTPEEELEGLRVNRAEQLRPGLVRVSLHEPLKRHPGLLPGVVVNRNKDHRFEKLLAQESAERTIPATLELVVRSNALELTGKTLELSATVRL